MINENIAKEIIPITDTEITKKLNPVYFKFNDTNISTSIHAGFLNNNISNITEVIPHTVVAINDIYKILDKKYYELPFTQKDFITSKIPVLSGKPIINGLAEISNITPVINNGSANLISNQSIFEENGHVDYVALTIYLCSAIKELKHRIEILESK